MKYLIALILFLGTFTASAQSTVNADVKVLLGISPDGFVFQVDGYKRPWLCRPQGDGVVECGTEVGTVTCVFKEEPIYFIDCKMKEEGNDAVYI